MLIIKQLEIYTHVRTIYTTNNQSIIYLLCKYFINYIIQTSLIHLIFDFILDTI